MNRWTWRLPLLALLAAAGCALITDGSAALGAPGPDAGRTAPLPVADQGGDRPLFIIERSKNANVVHYDARLTADGKFDPKQPVVAYWIMLAEKGQREELNWVEKRKAYGFNIKPSPSGEGYRMTVVAAPTRPISVTKDGGAVHAEMDIAGQPAILDKMYINSTDGLLGPKVHYIELHGKDKKTGETRFEKVVPK